MRKISTFLMFFVFLVWAGQINGQINISVGNSISENFDIGTSAAETMPANWKVDKNNAVRTLGSYLDAVTATERSGGNSMASNAPNGIYNFGAGEAAIETDRAIGGLSSGSASKSVNIYTQLKNNSSTEISDFTISYNVEKYRNGTNAAGFSIQMHYSTDGTTWTSAGDDFLTSFAADADTEGYANAPGSVVNVTNKTLPVALAADGVLYLAWNYSVTSGTTTSSSQALAIDDVSIAANGTSLPLEDFDVTFSVVGTNGTLTASVDAVDITSPASVQEGKDVVFTAVPAVDYQVKQWKLNSAIVAGNTSNTYTITNLDADANVSVEFEAVPTTTYAITFGVVNGNGDLTATVDELDITSPADVLEGKDVMFTAVPAVGFQVKEWKLNDLLVAGNTSNEYILADVSAISNVSVEFEALPTYTITFTVKDASDVDITNAIITFDGVANPAGDYIFNNIAAGTYDYTVVAPSYQASIINGFVVTEATTIPVVLQNQPIASLPINYSGTWQSGLPDGWTQTGLGSDYSGVAARFDDTGDNMMVQFNGTPNTLSYTIKANASGAWLGEFNVEESADGILWTSVKKYETDGELTGVLVTETFNLLATTRNIQWTYTTKGNGNIALDDVIISTPSANFDITYSVVGTNGTLTASVDAVDIASPASVQEGKDVVFTAVPAVDYQVKEWKLNSAIVAGNTSNIYTITNLDSDADVSVEFEAVPTTTYAITFGVVNGNGDLTATVDELDITSPADVLEGKDVVFTAAPAVGFQVKEWKLNDVLVVGNTTNNYTLTDVSAISSVSVEFEAIPTYTVTFEVRESMSSTLITNAIINFNGVENSGGNYVFSAIYAGSYSYTVAASGYETLNPTSVQINQDTTITVLLQTELIANLPIDYSGPWQTGLSAGWTQTGLGSDYVSGACKFDNSDDYLKVHFDQEPGVLIYSIKGNTSGSVSWNGTFDIMESADGSTWTSVESYSGVGEIDHTAYASFTHNLLSTTRIVKWVYTEKIIGNVGLENVIITLPLQDFDVTFDVVGANGTLTASVDDVDITSPASVQEGKNVVFTAVPDIDYQVKEWKLNSVVVDLNTSNTYILSNLEANADVSVEFEEIPTTTFAITFGVVNGNGDLTATVDELDITSPADVLIGKNILFTAEPMTNFQVKEWKLNDVIVEDNTSLNFTLMDLQGEANVTVEFEAVPTYTVTFEVEDDAQTAITNAIISFNGVDNSAGNYLFTDVSAGSYSYTVEASGYETLNPTSVQIMGDTTITVVLQAELIANLPIDYSGPWLNGLPAGWTQSGLGSDYASGAAKFDSSDDYIKVRFDQEPGALKYDIRTFTSGTSFPWNGTFDILESADGVMWTSIVSYTGLEGISHTEYNVFTHNLLPTSRYVKWIYDEKISGNVSLKNVIITLPLQNFDVTFDVVGANGTLTASVEDADITSPASVQEGSDVVFTAVPEVDYQVKEWKLNSVVIAGNTSNTYTLSDINADADVSVEFEEIPEPNTYVINFSVIGTNGTLIAKVDDVEINTGDLVEEGNDVVFTATPENGYRVKEWTLNSAIVPANTTNEYTATNIMFETNVNVEFEIDGTGIFENNSIFLNIYPNPSNGVFTIDSDGLYTMEVLDIQGRLMVRRSLENGLNILDMTAFANGIYLVRVNNVNHVYTTRISKSK